MPDADLDVLQARRPNCTCSASPGSSRWTSSRIWASPVSTARRPSGRPSWTTARTSTPRDRAYVAMRVPQVDGNPTLKRAILAGHVEPEGRHRCRAGDASRHCARSTARRQSRRACLDALGEYEVICQSKKTLPRRVRGDPDGRAVDALRVHALPRARHRDRHLPRHRAQQAPRLPQPVGARRQDGATDQSAPRRSLPMADRYDIRLPAIRIRQGEQFIYASASTASGSTTSRPSVAVHRDDTRFRATSGPRS